MESFNEPIDQYIQGHKKEWYFRELMEKFRMEKGFDSFGMICLEAEINRDALYKVMRFATGTYNRDMLWALAVVMGLTLEETEMLFNSCGMTTKDCRSHMGERNQYQRERAIEFGILNGWDIITIDEELKKRGFSILGKE